MADPRQLVEGSKKARGRPRLERTRDVLQLEDLERIEVYGVCRRAQAIALSEYWRTIEVRGPFHPVQIPQWLHEAALELLAPVPLDSRGEPAPDPVVFAQAVLELLPARRGDDPVWLRREGRNEEAELEELHGQLDVFVKRIKRLAQRARGLQAARVAGVARTLAP